MSLWQSHSIELHRRILPGQTACTPGHLTILINTVSTAAASARAIAPANLASSLTVTTMNAPATTAAAAAAAADLTASPTQL